MLLSPATHGPSRKAIDVALHVPMFLRQCVATGLAHHENFGGRHENASIPRRQRQPCVGSANGK